MQSARLKKNTCFRSSVQRPNLGCRTLVQNEMMKIIPTLMLELQDWVSYEFVQILYRSERPKTIRDDYLQFLSQQAGVRIKSSELLKIIVLHGENRIVSFLDVALPAMSKACMDEEVAVCKNVRPLVAQQPTFTRRVTIVK